MACSTSGAHCSLASPSAPLRASAPRQKEVEDRGNELQIGAHAAADQFQVCSCASPGHGAGCRAARCRLQRVANLPTCFIKPIRHQS